MIGLIQKVLLELLEAKGGTPVVQEVLARAGVPADRVFRIGDLYSDEEFRGLLKASCDVLHATEDEVFEAYADFFFKDATVRFSKWFELAKNSHDFLIFQTTIHNTFASSVVDPQERQAVKDKTSIERVSDRYLITHYKSPNELCGLYKALGRWIANYYGDTITIEETGCLKRGDPECELHVKWTNFGDARASS